MSLLLGSSDIAAALMQHQRDGYPFSVSLEIDLRVRRLQEESVNVERQTFGVGLSTNLQVIQYEDFLAQSRSTEVASRGAYVKAKIALQRATGTILDDNHVAIDEAYRGNVAHPPSPLPSSSTPPRVER